MAHDRILYGSVSKKEKPKNYRRWILFAASVIFLILVCVGLVHVFRYSKWQIAHIEVAGTETIDPQEIRDVITGEFGGKYFFVIPKTSFFLVRTAAISEAVGKKFLKIDSISSSKTFPDILEVSIKERSLWGIYCNNFDLDEIPDKEVAPSSCVYVDTRGFSFEPAPDSFGSLIIKIRSDGPLPEVGNQIIPEATSEKMRYVGAELASRLKIEVTGYELITKLPGEFRVVTREGFRIYFNRNDDFENVFRVLGTLFQGELKNKKNSLLYIDARFGNKVFYKLKK